MRLCSKRSIFPLFKIFHHKLPLKFPKNQTQLTNSPTNFFPFVNFSARQKMTLVLLDRQKFLTIITSKWQNMMWLTDCLASQNPTIHKRRKKREEGKILFSSRFFVWKTCKKELWKKLQRCLFMKSFHLEEVLKFMMILQLSGHWTFLRKLPSLTTQFSMHYCLPPRERFKCSR